MAVENKEEILVLLRIARVNSIEAISLFNECSQEFYYNSKVISKVIHFVKEGDLRKAMTIINNLQDDWTKQIALFDLALHAQSYDLDFALEIADQCDSYYKPKILKSIVSEVVKSDIEFATKITQSIDNIASKMGALAAIASYAHDEEFIDESIKIARTHQICDYNDGICEILTNIASSIAGNFPHKAIELLKEISCNKDIAIEVIALNFSDTALAIELIKTSLDDEGIPSLSLALGEIALKIAEKDKQKALAFIDEIQNKEVKEDVLFWLHEEWEQE